MARPSERIRTASEIHIEVALTDEDAFPAYVKTSEKVLHLRRLGIAFPGIAERLGDNFVDGQKSGPVGQSPESIGRTAWTGWTGLTRVSIRKIM